MRSLSKSFFASLFFSISILAGAAGAALGSCGPFTDVAADAFCPFVLEIFTLGITTGTTATTYDPSGSVTRVQMAAFLSRTVDGVLRRGNRRAAMDQFWTSQGPVLGTTTITSGAPFQCRFDGADVWVTAGSSASVARVRASDGKLLDSWTGALSPAGVLVALNRVFVTGSTSPGALYRIDPTQTAGSVTTVSSSLSPMPEGIAFDGSRIWTADVGTAVSIVTPGASIPWTVTNVTAGFSQPFGIVYDGANMWVTDFNFGTLLKLDASGAILQTVTVGSQPRFPAFDGANLWVPNGLSDSVTVVRASNGAVLGTLTGNGLSKPFAAAFDGQRVLVANALNSADNVSLWKAADLSVIGSFSTGALTRPIGACSDGVNFWITLQSSDQLAKF